VLLEQERLAALRSYDVLDTSPEPAFDELTLLARALCDVPIALVSLVDENRQWFKSCFGLETHETPRALAFCAHTIQRDTPMIVPDARKDPRFADNPLVTESPNILFYAGFPLIDRDGAALGTLCVIDTKPRTLTEAQHNALGVLAHQVVAQLHLRRVDAALRQQLARDSFLAEAGTLLAASLDIDETLQAVANLAVPRIADLCSIMRVEADGTLHRVAESAIEKPLEAEVQGLRDAGESASLAMRHAIAEKKTVLFTDYRKWLADRLPADDSYRVVVERLGVRSAIIAPLTIAGRIRGMLNVAVMQRTGRKYDANAVVTMEGLAQQAAMALENARLFADAHEANRTKDLFLAAVSHDLRTPLSAILGWTQMMRRKPDDPEVLKKGVEIIERSARTQARLIDDLLDVSRISNGTFVTKNDAVDFVTVVETALETLRPSADAQGVRIQASLDPDARPVRGDADRFTQVVWNLVSNALKFSSRGSAVEVALVREGNTARLTIRDHGRGIAPEFLPYIFDQFRQDEDGRKRGGLGLGLAISKHIVEAAKGTIAAFSAGLGEGALFTVVLPRNVEVAGTAEER
jgi:signal transduction histidine kinase